MNRICRFCQHYGGCCYLRDGLQDKCDIILHGEEWYYMGWEDAVNKACEWIVTGLAGHILRSTYGGTIITQNKLIEDFHKAMEDEL